MPQADDTWTRPADEMALVYVPAGEFQMGSTDVQVDEAFARCKQFNELCLRRWFEHEQPVHTVVLDGFWIDRTEVTNGQYQRCVQAGECDPPGEDSSWIRDSYYGNSAYDNYPVIYVTWHQAADYCSWADGRLPTEAEWEYAARGPESLECPWGDEFDGTCLNYCDANCRDPGADHTADDGYEDTAPAGSYPDGASWCGALDMAGNVLEWVADWYGEYPSERQENPTGPASGLGRVGRGGSWFDAPVFVRGAFRYYLDSFDSGFDHGFRCAKDAD